MSGMFFLRHTVHAHYAICIWVNHNQHSTTSLNVVGLAADVYILTKLVKLTA